MPFDGTPPRKQTLTPQKVLRDLSQLLREPERWPEGFRWHYGTINTCAIGLCREALGERAYRKLASHIDYPVDRTHYPETSKIFLGCRSAQRQKMSRKQSMLISPPGSCLK
jgi:hypothetical protein